MAQNPPEHCLVRARDLYMNNVFSLKDYGFKEAMIEAGISEAIASIPSNQQLVGWKVQQATNGSPLSFDPSMEAKATRFNILYRSLYETEQKKPGVVDVMKRAGYYEWPEIYKEGRVQSKYYARCSRASAQIEVKVDIDESRKRAKSNKRVETVKKEFETLSSDKKVEVLVHVLGQLDERTRLALLRSQPPEHLAMLSLNQSVLGKDEDLVPPVTSSNQNIAEEDTDSAWKSNCHGESVDDNELTLEEKQCAEMLRELDLADKQCDNDE